MIVTVFSLTINLFFKFVSPPLFSYSLDRAQEMMLGVCGPLLLLLFFEFVPTGVTMQLSPSIEEPSRVDVQEGNTYAVRILGYAVLITGAIVVLLGFGADVGRWWVILIGVIVEGVGFLLLKRRE